MEQNFNVKICDDYCPAPKINVKFIKVVIRGSSQPTEFILREVRHPVYTDRYRYCGIKIEDDRCYAIGEWENDIHKIVGSNNYELTFFSSESAFKEAIIEAKKEKHNFYKFMDKDTMFEISERLYNIEKKLNISGNK